MNAAESNAALNRLSEAIAHMRTDGVPAQSPELRAGSFWQDIGPSWIRGWVDAVKRDVGAMSREIATATQAADAADAHEHLENALWRLDSAREKLHAVIALAFAVPGSFRLKPGGTKGPTFDPDADANRRFLKTLDPVPAEAVALLEHDATLNSKLLLRHQTTHSLAPLTSFASLAWFEVGHMRDGGVVSYEARHLIPRGIDNLRDIGDDTLTKRSIGETEQGLHALVKMIGSLADLIAVAAVLPPPFLVWRVEETGGVYLDKSQASQASRTAQDEGASPTSGV